jgi:hypothetical protein
MTEAAQRVVDWGFQYLGCFALTHNTCQQSRLWSGDAKDSMKYEGTLRQHHPLRRSAGCGVTHFGKRVESAAKLE